MKITSDFHPIGIWIFSNVGHDFREDCHVILSFDFPIDPNNHE